mmetsp:Transcript_143227/g.457884  ORF Transcript_143227/g.457884 Transcript_143227/m.457884 type:complete len:335 (+) Transcript_143227:781-1785(+)
MRSESCMWTCEPGTNSGASAEPRRPPKGLPASPSGVVGEENWPGTNSGDAAFNLLPLPAEASEMRPLRIPPATTAAAATATSSATCSAVGTPIGSCGRPSSRSASWPRRLISSAQKRNAKASFAATEGSPTSPPALSRGARARLQTFQPSLAARWERACAEATSEHTTSTRPSPRPSRATTPSSPSGGTGGGAWPIGTDRYTRCPLDAKSGQTDRSIPTSQTTTPRVSGEAREARPKRQKRGTCLCTVVWKMRLCGNLPRPTSTRKPPSGAEKVPTQNVLKCMSKEGTARRACGVPAPTSQERPKEKSHCFSAPRNSSRITKGSSTCSSSSAAS